MPKNNMIIKFLIFILILDLSSNDDDYDNRHENFALESNCNKKGENDRSEINNADDCFKQKPGRKWKCCYYEYKDGTNDKKGCMRYRKNNESDLNDLKDYISTFSANIMLVCRQNYLIYSFGILFAFLLFLL